MKKIILSLIIVGVTALANAQGVHIGIKAGANMNKISGMEFKSGYELGYHAGLFSEVYLGKKFAIQPELLWNQVNMKKATGTQVIINGWQDSSTKIQLKYLTVPLLIKYHLSNNFALNLGAQYGILIDQQNSTFGNAKEAIKSGDFSVVGGFTVDFTKLRVYGRYNIGLNNLSDVQNTDQWKSQQIQLGIGYSIL